MSMEPTPEEIRDHRVYADFGLTDAEYELICEKLGRAPNYVEVGIFSVMWSEHCSYKNSRPVLSLLPTKGPHVLVGPGEGAGIVDIGDGQAVAFKIESHNHPSAVEPYQGAATGVGGILRDIFSMGARPVALLNSLRFGPLSDGRNRYLFERVVEGIGGYGNCVGVPTVGGEAVFDDAYSGNPLVNVMCVGLIDHDQIQKGVAGGVGNPVFYVGPATGRDGIHGATFASEELNEESEERRPAVQVGDPFMKKLVMESCLELIDSGIVVGIQDMGAAGLTCSSAEMASKAGNGMELYLDRVPCRAEGMTPYEMMLSESQERMLFVVRPEHVDRAREIFERWEVPCVEVGKVTDDGRLRLIFHGEEVGDLPVRGLVDDCPVYERAVERPGYLDMVQSAETLNDPEIAGVQELTAALKAVLADHTVASKRWIYEQFDHMVQGNTVQAPGGDAAVVEVQGTRKALAMALDGDGRHVFLDPYEGGKATVAEAARNLVCVGARPLAVTDNLNFGSPERPEIYFQLHQSVAGMAEACEVLKTPVIGGNVSLYNEHAGQAIYPTPVVGMVGLIEDRDRMIGAGFRGDGDLVAVLGATGADLGGSAFRAVLHGAVDGAPPSVDLQAEARLQDTMLRAVEAGLLSSAHDCSHGGLATTIAEKAIAGGRGANVRLKGDLRGDHHLFSETTGRIVVSAPPEAKEALEAIAADAGVPLSWVGEVGGEELTITVNDELGIESAVADLRDAYEGAIPRRMEKA